MNACKKFAAVMIMTALSACTKNPAPQQNTPKPNAVIINKETTYLGSTYIRLDTPDEYANHAEEIDQIYETFKAAHPDWHIIKSWVHFRDASYNTPPMIYGIHIEHEPCHCIPRTNQPLRQARPSREKPSKK
jgi:hypothetical protein